MAGESVAASCVVGGARLRAAMVDWSSQRLGKMVVLDGEEERIEKGGRERKKVRKKVIFEYDMCA